MLEVTDIVAGADAIDDHDIKTSPAVGGHAHIGHSIGASKHACAALVYEDSQPEAEWYDDGAEYRVYDYSLASGPVRYYTPEEMVNGVADRDGIAVMNRFYGKTEVLEKIALDVDARLVGTDDPEEQGEKSHLESIETVANDQDKKCCPGPLDTDEKPDKCEKGRLVGVQNDMGKKCYPNSLRIKENPDKCEESPCGCAELYG